jgi:hypothetical protein
MLLKEKILKLVSKVFFLFSQRFFFVIIKLAEGNFGI